MISVFVLYCSTLHNNFQVAFCNETVKILAKGTPQYMEQKVKEGEKEE